MDTDADSGNGEVTDGVYMRFDRADGKFYGMTSNGATFRDTTATGYTPVADTWYHGRIYLSTAADTAFYQLWKCSSGTPPSSYVWTGNLTANIPTTVGHETSNGFVIRNRAQRGRVLVDWDWIMCTIGRTLTR